MMKCVDDLGGGGFSNYVIAIGVKRFLKVLDYRVGGSVEPKITGSDVYALDDAF